MVNVFRKASKAICGFDRRVCGVEYTCDAHIFVNQMRIPTIICGPGDMHQAHRPGESLRVDELLDSARIYTTVAVKLLS